MTLAEEEIKSKRTGWIVTILVHLLILLFFWLYNVWPFNPPVERQYGVQVNFGVSEEGSANIQNQEPPGTSEAVTPVENSEEATETSASAPSETEPTENTDIQESVETTEAESEVSASKTESTESTQPASEQSTKSTETKTSETASETKTASSASNNNNGNDVDKVGDKGSEKGKINDSDIYKGTPGDGGGSGAHITGWKTDGQPKGCQFNETGKIVFKIVIDDEGEIISVTTLEKTVSSRVEICYKQQIEQLSFIRKQGNEESADRSEGTYVVNLKAE